MMHLALIPFPSQLEPRGDGRWPLISRSDYGVEELSAFVSFGSGYRHASVSGGPLVGELLRSHSTSRHGLDGRFSDSGSRSLTG